MTRDTGRAFRRSRADFRAEGETVDEPCWICGMSIDYTVPDWTTDDSWSLDHYWPVSLYPELQTDPAGYRHCHTSCNRQRSNNAPHPGIGTTSRQWL